MPKKNKINQYKINRGDIDLLNEKIRFLEGGLWCALELILNPKNKCNKLRAEAFLCFIRESENSSKK